MDDSDKYEIYERLPETYAEWPSAYNRYVTVTHNISSY